ncbi:MAG: hypothetical protein FJZ47_15805 [Candidatus Tectomicrobia bacterium]|uniref:Uncharacterized protein n=1 Tax=Tectimicrobiota bacterium TaxID=2528274 RepID=A0A937W4G1_UNCTE|nr:hypothetical protein [Candidatus Tectomicrobia bacterium]
MVRIRAQHRVLGAVLTVVLSCLLQRPCALAHHGGLGIEGDLVQWALKVDQWQEEGIAEGHRIKFLSYPRQPVLGGSTRLVFEIQSTATGQYVTGLTAQLDIRTPDGTQRLVPLPEITGVTAYYEGTVTFEQEGEHTLTWHSTAGNVPFSTTFRKTVSRSPLTGDWPTLLGYSTVAAAFLVTWVGLVLSVQRRFATAWR